MIIIFLFLIKVWKTILYLQLHSKNRTAAQTKWANEQAQAHHQYTNNTMNIMTTIIVLCLTAWHHTVTLLHHDISLI